MVVDCWCPLVLIDGADFLVELITGTAHTEAGRVFSVCTSLNSSITHSINREHISTRCCAGPKGMVKSRQTRLYGASVLARKHITSKQTSRFR